MARKVLYDGNYLHICPRGNPPEVQHVARDTQHGGERREPAEDVRPPGVLVVHVLDGLPLDQVEDKHALTKTKTYYTSTVP